MLGWFGLSGEDGPGRADAMLEALAGDLAASGVRLAGAVQRNLDRGADCACDMEMHLLGTAGDAGGTAVRISQDLGAGSQGCRLDTGALEQAAHRARGALAGADLVIVPKFGRQEATGRGFCDLIADALSRDLPVILHVPRQQRAAFAAYAGDLAHEVAPARLAAWCRASAAARARRTPAAEAVERDPAQVGA